MNKATKLISIFVAFTTLCVFSSCSNKAVNKNTETTSINIQPHSISTETTNSEIIKISSIDKNQTKESIKDTTTVGEGGGIITIQKYRSLFYDVAAPFVDLVGQEVYLEWREATEPSYKSEKMLISQFVQHFGITREQFEKANLECARIIQDKLRSKPCLNPKDYANQIITEIYNTDIIFSFDDNLIREYYISPEYPYLYDYEFEEAVAKGEYKSQTEEWVDVEAMEAEIIAKYGEAEIVTDITEQTASETTAEITTTVETIIPETEIQITE